jgi:hypothetical protein
MELFIFVRMGGNRDDIKVSLLADNNLGINVYLMLSRFDASQARCFLDGALQHRDPRHLQREARRRVTEEQHPAPVKRVERQSCASPS